MRKPFFILAVILVAVITYRMIKLAPVAKAAVGQMRVNLAETAVNSFNFELKRYPTNLSELRTNSLDQVFAMEPMVDGYGRALVYQAPGASNGFVGTYGRDGKPGGTKFDADYVMVLTNGIGR